MEINDNSPDDVAIGGAGVWSTPDGMDGPIMLVSPASA
jgi:hypothetical protein